MYFIDANIFLELLLDQKKADECQIFLEAVQKGRTECFVTDLVLDSILIVLEDKGKAPSELRQFLAAIAALRGLRLYFLTLLDRLEATKIMRVSRLDFEDSTLVRAARRLGAEGIVTFDRDFDRVKDLNRLEPLEIVKQYKS